MLDHLKQQSQAGAGARERARLAIFVGALVLVGGAIVASTAISRSDKKDEPAETPAPSGEDPSAGPTVSAAPTQRLEPLDMGRLASARSEDDAQPHRWSLRAFEYLESVRRHGEFPDALTPTTTAALQGAATTQACRWQLDGRVIDRAQEAYEPPNVDLQNATLWSLVVEEEPQDGRAPGTFVVVVRGDAQAAHGGAPTALAPGHVSRPIEVGDTILAQGIYLQSRLGTVGETVLREEAPVLYGLAMRRDVPIDARAAPIASPEDAAWDEVRDLTLAETQRWDEDVLYQLIQWARARGANALRQDIEDGSIPWKEWDRDTFEQVWKKEVDPEEGVERSFTEGARGQLFRLDGIVADSLVQGWDVVPPNAWRIHHFGLLTLLADDYRHVAVRLFNPFDIDTFEGVEGKRKDHVRVWGMFVKNHTYRLRHKDPNTGDYRFLTVPLFVLLRADPHPGASDTMMTAMYWVAGGMVLLALLFYLILVRGGRKQFARMEEQRQRLRKKRVVPTTESAGE